MWAVLLYGPLLAVQASHANIARATAQPYQTEPGEIAVGAAGMPFEWITPDTGDTDLLSEPLRPPFVRQPPQSDSASPQAQQFADHRIVQGELNLNWLLFWSLIGGATLLATLVLMVFFRWHRILRQEIERRHQAEQEARRLAMSDSLTGLANRSGFFQRFREAISLADRQQHELGLLWLDLDKFKPVNESYGHPAGDQLLKALADRLLSVCRESDMVARMGGDEFALLIINPESEQALRQVAERLVNQLIAPVEITAAEEVSIGVSIGIAIYPEHGISSTILLENADKALYEAKRMGGNRYRIYNASTATISRPLDLLTEDD
ncbi:GGDEF domain-containing protein [Marinobacterium jannaschii]|uniref:GGDEF domain-containing protein n=1 Tax=Marinobacterium jannaschii TaxID=64970 RepID=UPI0012EBDAA1|nr:GGDEF domain-containing protein [Marinobacterium jannaschii]